MSDRNSSFCLPLRTPVSREVAVAAFEEAKHLLLARS
jgi:hypothetical protein